MRFLYISPVRVLAGGNLMGQLVAPLVNVACRLFVSSQEFGYTRGGLASGSQQYLFRRMDISAATGKC